MLFRSNMLMDLGEEKIAIVVRRHRYNGLIDPKEKPTTWEEKILYYADKRVMHDQIVSLQKRVQDMRERYFPDGNLPASDQPVEKAIFKLEKELCLKAGIKPESINEKAVEPFLES